MIKTSIMKKALSVILGSAMAFTLAVTGIMPGTGAIQAKAESNDQVTAFVERMYTQALGREAEEAGKADWVNQLTSHTKDGAGLAFGFIRSEEFNKRNLTDEEYLNVLYKTFFNREPDAGGYNDWLAKLKAGTPRETILSGFVDAMEFTQLCVDFDISRGYMFETGAVADPGVGLFVYRLYEKLLGRKPDATGLNDWTSAIATNAKSATEVAAEQFIGSQEFQNRQKNLTNEEYVDVLYSTFFDRVADEGGKATWLQQLSWGAERENIVSGFAGSPEFKNVQAEYNIEAKEPTKPFVPIKAEDAATLYWDSVGQKTYNADNVLIAQTVYDISPDGRHNGYKSYRALEAGKDLKLEYEYKNIYNAQGILAANETYSYQLNSNGTSYLSYKIVSHYAGTATNNVQTFQKTENYNSNGKVVNTSEYHYANGVRTERVDQEFETNGRLKKQTTVKLNAKGKETEARTEEYAVLATASNASKAATPSNASSTATPSNATPDGQYVTFLSLTKKTYDANGNQTSEVKRETSYNTDKSVRVEYVYETTFKYDGKNLVEKISTFNNGKGAQNQNRSTYSYDGKDNQVAALDYYWTGTEWRLTTWISKNIDTLGGVSEETSYSSPDGTKEKSVIKRKETYVNKKMGDSIFPYIGDTYYTRSVMNPETRVVEEKLVYSYGYENVYDGDFLSEYKMYTADANNQKTLLGTTKYTKNDFPSGVALNSEREYRTSENYSVVNGKLVLSQYEVITYRYIKSK